ncbi:MAG: cyclase family protein [Luteitalea sp.]|nr:cyclase family protein [Luteitalea sp.]
MKLIDVTDPLDQNTPTYPGNTAFTIEPIRRLARGDTSNVSTLHISAHAGTHVDAPRHFPDDGPGVETLALEILCGRARVIELTTRKTITPNDLAGIDLNEDVRVLLKTHNSRLWGSPEFHPDFIGVTDAGAHYLVERGVKVVGADVEPGIYEMFCLPLSVVGADGAPARVVLRRS